MMKLTTLEDLYYGNISPCEVNVVSGSEYDRTSKLVVHYDEDLTVTLTEQQKETFINFKEAKIDLLNLGERDAFIRGFSLGVRMMIDVMNSGKT